jgi:catechol-2,3-dioxygenase
MEQAMQLNHLDLSVPDVALTAAFFQTALGFTHVETKGNGGMAILEDGRGFVLVLTRAQKSEQSTYQRTFHIGFLLESEQNVTDAYQRVISVGTDPVNPPREVRGALMFYCYAPGGILIEVSHRRARSSLTMHL